MNGRRPAIALAECQLSHRLPLLDLLKQEQRDSEFLVLDPTGVGREFDTGGPYTPTQSV